MISMKVKQQFVCFQIRNLLILIGTVCCIFEGIAEHNWNEQIKDFKPMVVNIETSSEIVFETEVKGTSFATGFIIDAERGIIATNRHVTGSSPSYVKINFYDGSFTEARVLYYNLTHDFGFYQIYPEDIPFELKPVQFASWKALALGDELLLIGNNEKEEYSIKFGTVTNLNVDKGDRHSSYIHTTFDRTGGSSGSPVWNTKGEVVAIHARGTDTSSFELPIEYLIDALKQIQNNSKIQHGEIGVDLELISIGEAIKHFKLPEASRIEIGPSEASTPKVMQIASIIPRTTGNKLLRASDIIYRINGQLIRDDLYKFDFILNEQVDNTVSLEIYRNGENIVVDIPVENLEHRKLDRFARFSGSIFHDITPELRRLLYFEANGVYLPHAEAGSSFSMLGRRERNGNSKIVIQEMNGHQIVNLDSFIQACQKIPNGAHTYVVIRDFNLFDSSPTPRSLTINLKFGPLQVFEWNQDLLDWKETKIKSSTAANQ